jgi:hypothetical protein
MEGFELFESTGRRGQPVEPKITIGKNGALTLNTLAISMFGEENPECVQLLYNAATQTIALKLVPLDAPFSYRLRKAGSSQSRSVSARGFLEHHGIDYGERREFTPTVLEPGITAFSLSEETSQQEKSPSKSPKR